MRGWLAVVAWVLAALGAWAEGAKPCGTVEGPSKDVPGGYSVRFDNVVTARDIFQVARGGKALGEAMVYTVGAGGRAVVVPTARFQGQMAKGDVLTFVRHARVPVAAAPPPKLPPSAVGVPSASPSPSATPSGEGGPPPDSGGPPPPGQGGPPPGVDTPSAPPPPDAGGPEGRTRPLDPSLKSLLMQATHTWAGEKSGGYVIVTNDSGAAVSDVVVRVKVGNQEIYTRTVGDMKAGAKESIEYGFDPKDMAPAPITVTAEYSQGDRFGGATVISKPR